MSSPSRNDEWNAKVWAAFRAGGVRLVVVKAIKKVLSPLVDFGSVVFFTRDLSGELPPARDLPEFVVREASLRDLSLVREACEPSRGEEELRRRLEGGDQCFIALGPDNHAANTRWLTTKGGRDIPELDLRVVLRPGEAYTYDTYTRPEIRIRGLDGMVRRHVLQNLRERGFRRVHSYVRSDNPPGLSATCRWQQRVARIWYFRRRGSRAIVSGHHKPDLPLLQDTEPEHCSLDKDARARAAAT